MEKNSSWTGEKFYFRGDDYFNGLLTSLDRARKYVDFETYIFEPGQLGNRVVGALTRAAKRGVKVRLLVDGVGSPNFASHYGRRLEEAGVPFRVYRSWSVFFSTLLHRLQIIHLLKSFHKIRVLWDGGKHRDHRKQCVVDGKEVWLGSFNVSDWHLHRLKGKKTWRDTGLRLTGLGNLVFQLAFQSAWEDPWPRGGRRLYRQSLARWLLNDIRGGPIRVTANRRLRRSYRRELLERIDSARGRVWIVTPYFVPTGPLLKALSRAARRGCEVRLVLPGETDVPMVRWVSMTFFHRLLRAGCRIFEYQGSVLHAKTTLIDSWALVGSSNLDYRSLRQDLEINVVPQEKKSISALEMEFEKDLRRSREVKRADLERAPFWMGALSKIFFFFRFWL